MIVLPVNALISYHNNVPMSVFGLTSFSFSYMSVVDMKRILLDILEKESGTMLHGGRSIW